MKCSLQHSLTSMLAMLALFVSSAYTAHVHQPSNEGDQHTKPNSLLISHQNLHLNIHCGLNGAYTKDGGCVCDSGWMGPTCSVLHLAPMQPLTPVQDNKVPGVDLLEQPTWGGGAAFEDGRWHVLVGARAVDQHNRSLNGYPCDSKIIRAVSATSDPSGPYTVAETVFPRTSWEPAIAKNPVTNELVVMFFGNITAPPDLNGPGCQGSVSGNAIFNLTTTSTYISVSKSGSIKGPWETPILVKGMENKPRPEQGVGPYSWNCASGNPSPAFHPNGTLYAAVRQNPCWKGHTTREHIGLWRTADAGGWNGEWSCVSTEPLYGWGTGGGREQDCTDLNGCPCHEDPHLWWDERGAHLLTHDQNNHNIHSTRGAYGWSLDGTTWNLETSPAMSNASAWDMDLRWANGTTTALARRQRPSFIRDPTTNKPTHLISGADLNHHLDPANPNNKAWCEGCHWGTGMTLIQPLVLD